MVHTAGPKRGQAKAPQQWGTTGLNSGYPGPAICTGPGLGSCKVQCCGQVQARVAPLRLNRIRSHKGAFRRAIVFVRPANGHSGLGVRPADSHWELPDRLVFNWRAITFYWLKS